MALQRICYGFAACLLAAGTTSAVLLQRTSTRRAVAAMQLAASRAGNSNVDADVAAESAALQSRCRLWIRSQEVLQKSLRPPADGMQGSTEQPQQLLGSSQQPQGTLRSTFVKCWKGLQNLCWQNLCFRACREGGHANMPHGSDTMAGQSGDAGVPAAIFTSGSSESAQHRANSSHDAASDASSIEAAANGGGQEDVGHLRGSSANCAAAEKLTQADVSSVTHRDLSGLQGTCTSIMDIGSVGNDRCACPGFLSHTLQ